MKIGIFGGSFNPIHKGHVKIALEAIKALKLDKLYFVPAYKSPFKTGIKYADWEHRVNMINMVKPEKSEVSLFEIKRKGVSYTIDTIQYFKNKFPNDELFLIIGSDNLHKLHKWRNIDEIAEKSKIVIFKREGKFSKENIKKYDAILLNNKPYNFSSTDVKFGNMDVLEDEVREYIGKNHLYILDILNNTLEAKRNKHSRATAELAVSYAKKLGYDSKKAWMAGLCHDITKNLPLEQHRNFLKKHDIDDSEYLDYQLHQKTGSLWLEKEYLIDDHEIVKAISVHTSLSKEMNTLDKIVFMADKLCDGRKFEGVQALRQFAFEDFEAAFIKMIELTKEWNLAKTFVTKEQMEIYDYWINKK